MLDAPAGPEFREALVRSVTDVPALVAEIDRLWTLLDAARLRYADLLAAVRATLAAARAGERDPLFYIRDEAAANEGRPA